MSKWSEAVDAQLQELYEQVPDVHCKGLCVDFCGPIQMGARERQRAKQAGVVITPEAKALQLLIESNGVWSCDALVEGRCAVYQARPMICRVWGAAEGLECPYGCKPDERLLTRPEAYALVEQALVAGATMQANSAGAFARALESPEGQRAQANLRQPTRNRKRSRQLRKGS